MVFLQAAARTKGPSALCVQAARDGRLELVVSPEIIAEVRDVLTRPRTLRKFPTLTVEAVEAFVRDIEALAIMVTDVPSVFVLERDPKDEPYLNLAIASGAAFLTTWDKDLLDLMGDEASRRQFPGLTIVEPPALLRGLEPA
jgi:putative PIN family toxin of toxin-antitoxin system